MIDDIAASTRVPIAAAAPSGTHGVSWAAILAGAAGAAALSLILLILGVGLGLSSVSPWVGQGVSAVTIGASTVIWLTFTQLAASGMGGYLAGRLRTRWIGTHIDEVYFRDTAHGFLSWAVASLVTAALLSSVIGSIVSSGAQVGAGAVGSAASVATAAVPAMMSKADSAGYFVDSLFRSAPASAPAAGASASGAEPMAASAAPVSSPAQDEARSTAEVGRIFVNALSSGTLTPDDTTYVGQLVAQRTGLSQADAEKRVTSAFTRMQAKAKDAEATSRDAADKARKASAYAALWLFVSLLIGAFVASYAATFGGRRRDLF